MSEQRKCSNCGFELNEDSMFCTNCGMRQITKVIEEPTKRCIECGHEISNDTVFCTTCGAKQPKQVSKLESNQNNIPTSKCKKCGEVLEKNSQFCTNCGAKVTSEEETPLVKTIENKEKCKKCGEVLEKNSQFCTNCGAKVTSEEPKNEHDDPIEVLKKLKEMKGLELITEEEFNEKKKEILNNLK